MDSPNRTAPAWRPLLAAVLATILLAPASHALRLVNYNVLNYPGSSGAARDPNFRTVLAPLNADVLITEEQTSQAGLDEFLNSVLNVNEPGQWAAAAFVNGNDTDAGLFYKPAKVQFLGQWSFYPSATNLRLIHVYRLKPVGYADAAAEFRIYAAHLKASQGFETDRLNECIGVRDSLNAMPPGTKAFFCGDMNFYTSTEPGYQKLIESQANNNGRLYDMLPAGTWHDGSAYTTIHTQSTCLTGCLYGEATGGKDDRFDFIFPTLSFNTTQGLAVMPGTIATAGADNQHFNKAITDAPDIPEGAVYAAALIGTSDHLPVRVDIQLPARIGLDGGPLAYGSVIVGAAASRSLGLSNPAVAPADSLNCTFSAPPGFVAPGPLALAAGASGSVEVGLDTTTPGVMAGSLSVFSDAPDGPLSLVPLSATVLDHAQASLDSLTALLADTLDFGEHAADGFPVLVAEVHDRDWTSLRARLQVSGVTLTGGDGRFSIPDFTPSLVAGTAGRWTVAFDASGALAGSSYEATLVFHSADEPLPGATAQPDLQYTLTARLAEGQVAVNGPGLPGATWLYAPVPNPTFAGSLVRFDLARAVAGARLEVFDLTGRRVASLLGGRALEPGRYSTRWDGREDGGAPVGPGLYFVRLSGPGLGAQTARLAVVR